MSDEVTGTREWRKFYDGTGEEKSIHELKGLASYDDAPKDWGDLSTIYREPTLHGIADIYVARAFVRSDSLDAPGETEWGDDLMLSRSQLRLHCPTTSPEERKFNFLLIEEKAGGSFERVVSQVVITVPADKNISDPWLADWMTAPTAGPSGLASFSRYLLPMEVNSPELYMFSGHTGDKVELCKASGTCEWRLKSASPAIGTFDHPTDLACSFTATTKGKNTIQLVMGGNVVWEKPTEVIEIVTRAGWGAVAPKAHTQTMPDFQHVTLHHTSNANTGAAEMQRIQQLHMSLFPYVMPFGPFKGKNFDDIGYHFIIDKTGVVYEGRQLEAAPGAPGGPYTKGEHVGSNNTVAGIGFCTMGDYEGTEGNEAWPAARQKYLEKAVSALCRRYKLSASKLNYHKALALPPGSLCPGSNYIPTIPDIIKHVTENLQ